MCVCPPFRLWRVEQGDRQRRRAWVRQDQEVDVLFRDIDVCETFTPFFWSRDWSLGSLKAVNSDESKVSE